MESKVVRPTGFNRDDGCMNYLEVEEGGRLVTYTGRGKDDLEAASIRSDHPLVPNQAPLGYFEVLIVNSGRNGYMSVGVMTRRSALDKLVGWGDGAIGYHGDDGFLFTATGSGHAFGPMYSDNDIIGCCVDLVRNRLFFTKNGKFVGHFVKLETGGSSQGEEWFAAVGLRTPKESMRVNFSGNFMFDHRGYEDDLKQWTLKEKLSFPHIPHESLKMVSDYCLYNGYSNTLTALFTNSVLDSKEQEEYLGRMVLRKKQLEALDSIKKGLPFDRQSIREIFPADTDGELEGEHRGDEGPDLLTLYHGVLEFMEFAFGPERGDLGTTFQLAFVMTARLQETTAAPDDASAALAAEALKDIASVLAFKDPRSSPVSGLLAKWREYMCLFLDVSCGNPLLNYLELVEGCIRARADRRIWSVLDDATIWFGGCLE